MPTKTKKVGPHTYYDEVGRLDEDLPEGPGYSSDNKGCGGSAAIILLILCLGILLVI